MASWLNRDDFSPFMKRKITQALPSIMGCGQNRWCVGNVGAALMLPTLLTRWHHWLGINAKQHSSIGVQPRNLVSNVGNKRAAPTSLTHHLFCPHPSLGVSLRLNLDFTYLSRPYFEVFSDGNDLFIYLTKIMNRPFHVMSQLVFPGPGLVGSKWG